MKSLPIILVVVFLAGCSGMGMHGTSGMSNASGTSSSGVAEQFDNMRHPRPGDIYFGG